MTDDPQDQTEDDRVAAQLEAERIERNVCIRTGLHGEPCGQRYDHTGPCDWYTAAAAHDRAQPALMTVEEVAAYLGVPVATIYVWRTRQYGPRGVKVGRYVRYRPRDVDAWLDAQPSGTGPAGLIRADQPDDLDVQLAELMRDPKFAAASALIKIGRIVGGTVDVAAAAERAAIVAWLRARGAEMGDYDEDVARSLAKRIERGEHLEAGDE